MLTRLRMSTAGESHGPRLTALLEGMPAGLTLDQGQLDALLARRQRGFGAGGRMKIERDRATIHAGLGDGRTSGGPIALEVRNRDWASWRGRAIAPMTKPRPGHADLAAAQKYGYDDLRHGLERASARETAARVAAGGVALQLLAALGVRVGGHVRRIGAARAAFVDPGGGDAAVAAWSAALDVAADDEMGATTRDDAEAFRAEVKAAIAARDTLGGEIEIVALGLPPGLGSHVAWQDRLDGKLAMAMASIPAMKGVEFGAGFAQSAQRGTEVHDAIDVDAHGKLRRQTNRCGGLEGGMSTGEPLVIRVAMKPIATTLRGIATVDLRDGSPSETAYERSDICAVPRALPIAESMAALVLADAMLLKLGGDSLDEILPRLATLRRGQLGELALRDAPWTFAYTELPASEADG